MWSEAPLIHALVDIIQYDQIKIYIKHVKKLSETIIDMHLSFSHILSTLQ